MTVSAQTIKSTQQTSDANGVLVLLTLAHASWAQPVRMAGDTRDWVSNGNTFRAGGFMTTLPQDRAEQAPLAEVEIVNVGRELIGELEALPPGGTIVVTLQLINRLTPNTIDYEMVADMVGIRATTRSIIGTLSNSSTGGRGAGVLRYDPETAPGVFSQ